MFQRRIPVWLRHPQAPSVRGVAVLAGTEAIVRGTIISVYPILMYRAYGDAHLVSLLFFLMGGVSMVWGLLVPWLIRFVPRRWLYTFGAAGYIGSAALAALGGSDMIAVAVTVNMLATVTVFVCFNAYILDYIGSVDLGRCETLKMFYSAAAWTVGPAGGVLLMQWWAPAPFMIAGLAACALLVLFWLMRFGNGKLITKARAPTPNPLAYLGRFFRQPRLVAGWLFAVLRSCGWWVYVVYVPVFAIERGLGESVGGAVLSLSNAMLFLTPLMGKWVQAHSVRQAVRMGFLGSGLAFVCATFLAETPWFTISLLFVGTGFLVLLDICGGLPFLMAVKPSERTEMSAVYSSFRDVSAFLAPGAAWLVLLAAPLSAIFAAAGVGLFAAWTIAGQLHPRLGAKREVQVSETISPLAPEVITDLR